MFDERWFGIYGKPNRGGGGGGDVHEVKTLDSVIEFYFVLLCKFACPKKRLCCDLYPLYYMLCQC